jgi:ribosomal protein S18
MNNELERTWKEAAVAYIKIPSRRLSGGTEKNQERVRTAGLRAEI